MTAGAVRFLTESGRSVVWEEHRAVRPVHRAVQQRSGTRIASSRHASGRPLRFEAVALVFFVSRLPPMAWLGALLVGLVLGLLGSGGSILTVPVLVYLVGEPDKLAIAESLGIVTIISLVGAVPFAVQGQVSWRSVGWFW